ncbi:hypothetical protein ACQCN2_14515 [Brevibacillus ginsengisoli]|uniref:TolB family protein n=1 Tax=Brevibacillus ginsengisoli TaxID=363854 RepID=UPI003CE765B9
MRDDERSLDQDLQDKTISQLLRHLKQIRQAVPVNYQLKADLKQKLLEQMRQMEATKHLERQSEIQAQPSKQSRWKRWVTLSIGAVVVVTAVVTITMFGSHSIRLDHIQPVSIPNAKYSIEEAAISPRGDQLAFITNEAKVRTYSIEDKSIVREFALPQTNGSYQAIAWSANGAQLAMIEQTSDVARIWVVDMDQQPRQYGSRLIYEEKNVTLRHLSWNPNGNQIAFTKDQNGVQEVDLVSTATLAVEPLLEGSQAVWSQDGKSLAFVQNGQVMVLDIPTKKTEKIDNGSSPSWLSDHELTYIGSDQQLMGASVNLEKYALESKEPAHTQNQTMKQASWSQDGKTVLFLANQQKNEWFIAQRDR